jgi:hypothetical protein
VEHKVTARLSKVKTATDICVVVTLDTWLAVLWFTYSYFHAFTAFHFTADQNVPVMALETGVNVSYDNII